MARRRKLRELLADVDWIRCAGEAATGPEAVSTVNRVRPDLLFLDIRMPGLSGLQVLEQLRHRPRVVFTTAYDEYAVTAFELRALDYLLKPFGRKRFAETLSRIRETFEIPLRARALERARDPAGSEGTLRRLFVRVGARMVPIVVSDVSRFEGRDDYVAIHVGASCHLAAVGMDDLERVRDRFLRIHRSHIVNLKAVRAMTAHRSGRLLISMQDGTELFASRSRSRLIRRCAV